VTALLKLLNTYRSTSKSEREKGTYFEELIISYLRYEATYQDLYSDVWTYADWAKLNGIDSKDTGIDLVAKTQGTNEYHAIQCKFYAEDCRIQKKDIDSFFTASGQKPFTHRVIVTTTNNWGANAEAALFNQQPPVTKIDLHDLENSQIDWSQYKPSTKPVLKPKYPLKPHQENALEAVVKGLNRADRGKLIMACGTGKTFTSLKIAEQLAGKGKRVLFLVPSLSLLSQTLTEWTQQSQILLHSFAVCSDVEVGKKRKKDDDIVQTFTHELRYPATTNGEKLAAEMAKRHDKQHMSVVFSTYHSIQVLNNAQKVGLPEFDLVICDEAHRTTGATFAGDDESVFVKVHDNNLLKAKKRLYMTATPRIYGDSAKIKEEQGGVTLCSMDDEALYGKELFVINFSEAVQRGLLTDYKVIVLTIDESYVNQRLQNLLKDENNSLKVNDAAKIIGCWKALAKQGIEGEVGNDTNPMQRAVAFCQVIEASHKGKHHKVSSKQIASMFSAVVEEYQKQAAEEGFDHGTLNCEAEHVDGSMNATAKEEKINWLKAQPDEGTCKILSNVRCLSEGVDVPALDAVLFLTPRNSQVDVVQSVGRVMRNAPGKQKGYVVLPVVIPAGMTPAEALNDNKVYKVVWEVLQALRSHDDQFDAMINKLDLTEKRPPKMEVIAITGEPKPKGKTPSKKDQLKSKAKSGNSIGEQQAGYDAPVQYDLQFKVGEIERALYAKIVKKCGNRLHWEEWANDIAKIARTHIDRITHIIENPANQKEQQAFKAFADELRDDLNDAITDGEVIEMLAQHLITKPVFDALFKDYSFASHNPVSLAMQQVLDMLQEHHLDKERDTLERFYASVQMRADGIDNAQGKQKIVIELYDKFFRNAFPKMTERLGIVYTPVEVVDFIIHSVNHLLQQEFGQTLGSKGVHIIDPFTGTGTFITRLLQSGLIKPEELKNKYQHEIHANEIVLLAYYIAAINIEATYHDLAGGEYLPFEGICLTDTFQMYEKDDLISEQLVENSERRKRQKALDIRVIMGNPPYSIGQKSENDNAENVEYPGLDTRIRDTYAEKSSATLSKGLYDSYIRAIRWASDRVGKSGIIGFVTNAGFLEANTADGLRKCLTEEFSSIYVFHLRGNQRTSGETSRREGGKIFGSGSRAPIAISFLVKNPQTSQNGQIYFHNIGDYLTREQKLDRVAGFESVEGITIDNTWQTIVPDEHGDWLNQRDISFDKHIVLGDKKGNQLGLFKNFSLGVVTARDAWCYNPSYTSVASNMGDMIAFYNNEVKRFNEANPNLDTKGRTALVDNFINVDPVKVSWSRALKSNLAKDNLFEYDADCITRSLYRPFSKQYLYFNRCFNEVVYQMPQIFPTPEHKNLVIMVKQRWSGDGQLALMLNLVPELQIDGGAQCFPLYLYAKTEDVTTDLGNSGDLFAEKPQPNEQGYTRKDGITDEGLQHFQTAYPHEQISKEDIFYYVYGLLHSEDYRSRYAANLSKELPRIPRVKTAKDFWCFSQAGRDLAELHLNYETVEIYPALVEETGDRSNPAAFYRVEKMKYAKTRNDENKLVNDLTTLIYNPRITVKNIPVEAYQYIVNGKPALDWVVERQCVKTDKKSGIVNDANDWAVETMNNPKYPLELFLRLITVSLETMKIVRSLPPLDIGDSSQGDV
jgi:predicted helicase